MTRTSEVELGDAILPKIAAVVHNVNALLELERAGGFKRHLKSFPDYEALATDLKKRFKFVGDSGIYHFLWTVKHPVPRWQDWARAHGIDWGGRTTRAKAAGGRPRTDGRRKGRPAP